MAKIFYKINAIPDGIKYKNELYLEDMFGNLIWPHAYPNRYSGLAYQLSANGDSKLSNEIYHQLVNIAKENSSQLWRICTDSTKTGENTIISGIYYGDAYYLIDANCIKT